MVKSRAVPPGDPLEYAPAPPGGHGEAGAALADEPNALASDEERPVPKKHPGAEARVDRVPFASVVDPGVARPHEARAEPPGAAGKGLEPGDLFGEDGLPVSTPGVAAPSQSTRPLRVDFDDVLPAEQARGAQRVGAASLEMSEFMTREHIEALERAKRLPAEAPTSIELEEERSGAVRVVREGVAIWAYLALGTALLVGIVIGGLALYYRHQSEVNLRELEELKNADRIHRALEQKRATDVTR
jgi:hypothetical protein